MTLFFCAPLIRNSLLLSILLLLLLSSPLHALIHEKDHHTPTRPVFHTFWCMGGSNPLNDKIITGFRSVLRTQRRVHFIVWTLPDCFHTTQIQVRDAGLSSYCPRSTIEVKSTAALGELLKNVPSLEKCLPAFENTNINQWLTAYSDLIRFIALYFYGGIYIDSDVVCIRSMASLYSLNFSFRWDSGVNHFNTAIMGFHSPGNALPAKIVGFYNSCTPQNFHPEDASRAMTRVGSAHKDLIMLPTLFFDPMQVIYCNKTQVPLFIDSLYWKPLLYLFSSLQKLFISRH